MKYSAVVLIALSVAGCGDITKQKGLIEECNSMRTKECVKRMDDANKAYNAEMFLAHHSGNKYLI